MLQIRGKLATTKEVNRPVCCQSQNVESFQRKIAGYVGILSTVLQSEIPYYLVYRIQILHSDIV